VDVYCKRCGEPWDVYGVEHGDMDDHERRRFWAGEGCPSCFGKEPCTADYDCDECPEFDRSIFSCLANRDKNLARQAFRAQVTAALHEILGDDIDGLAAELEDAEFLLGEKFWE